MVLKSSFQTNLNTCEFPTEQEQHASELWTKQRGTTPTHHENLSRKRDILPLVKEHVSRTAEVSANVAMGGPFKLKTADQNG